MSYNPRSSGRAFSVREPVRMDLAFNGARFIIGEFVIATLACAVIGGIEIALFFSQGQAEIHLTSGLFFMSCALNALTFLFLAIETVRHNEGLSRADYHHGQTLTYTAMAVVLLLVPLVFPLLALVQTRHT